MQVLIPDPVFHTSVFITVFSFLLILFTRPSKSTDPFPISLTNQLKGFAIFGVLFAHIGYVLASDNRFLYPFSVYGGIGVNIFLFLSGYGLAFSSNKTPLTAIEFYKKRLPKLFLPLWIILIIFLLLDFFLLQKTYPLEEIKNAFLGFFPRADVVLNINSPLWYFTPIFFYYLIFPFLFIKNRLYLTSIAIFAPTYLILEYYKLPVDKDIPTFYKLHTLAFPLGVLFAQFTTNPTNLFIKLLEKLKHSLMIIKLPLLLLLIYLIYYFSLNAEVGEGVYIEQKLGIFTTLLIILFFYLKKFEFKIFTLFGIFSYEIYLIHWPILFRYDFIYKNLPPSIATLLYLLIFLVLGLILQLIVVKFSNAFTKTNSPSD